MVAPGLGALDEEIYGEVLPITHRDQEVQDERSNNDWNAMGKAS